MKRTEAARVERRDAPPVAELARPDFEELMERAYVMVAIASPARPPRSRIEWLVGGWERSARAIDALLADGYLKEIEGLENEPRLTLGERRWPVQLPGESLASEVPEEIPV